MIGVIVIMTMVTYPYLMAVAHLVVVVPLIVAPFDPMGLRRSDEGRETAQGERKRAPEEEKSFSGSAGKGGPWHIQRLLLRENLY